ncbi:MAG: undecaprenyldiphospho-muramoylpentapeptide beta-N-acetylglucosaminyltransferase, partial [Spirochaetaceae bacterium]|nr:undecaprenyldiphospho-muramoylpentapeptide beta-N-acetylglucosaminyltransferase [Spirochaetaceae bacterium]
PGLAARLNFKLGARALVSYEKTLGYLSSASRKGAVVVGNPIREELFGGNLEKGRSLAGLKADNRKPLILVLGGSQGAVEVNNLVTGCLDSILQVAVIVHQTGHGNHAVPDADGYLSRPFFTHELPHLLAAADMVIARSGAGSVWELAATGTPAVFIPLRDATRGDQLLNASVAEETGISLTLGKGSNSQDLARIVIDLISDPERRRAMSDAAGAYPAREAAARITEVLMEYDQ